MQFKHTQTHKYITRYITHTPRTFATAMERNLDPIPGGAFYH